MFQIREIVTKKYGNYLYFILEVLKGPQIQAVPIE